MGDVYATVNTVMTASGSVDDFPPAVQDAMISAFANATGVAKSYIELIISAGSVVITFVVEVPGDKTAIEIQAAIAHEMSTLEAASDFLSEATGQTVQVLTTPVTEETLLPVVAPPAPPADDVGGVVGGVTAAATTTTTALPPAVVASVGSSVGLLSLCLLVAAACFCRRRSRARLAVIKVGSPRFFSNHSAAKPQRAAAFSAASAPTGPPLPAAPPLPQTPPRGAFALAPKTAANAAGVAVCTHSCFAEASCTDARASANMWLRDSLAAATRSSTPSDRGSEVSDCLSPPVHI